MALAEPERPAVREANDRAPVATLWRNGDFLRFWIGESASLIGTQVTALALPLTAVLVLHAGPEQLGILRFLHMIPYLIFGMLFGVWVDRVRRRPVMLASNLVRLVLIGAVPVLAATDHLGLALLYVITLGVGTAAVLFDVSWLSYLPTLVKDKRYLVEANGKLGATSSAADAAGPGIAGGLVGAFTAPIAMTVNAFTYLASLISLLLIRTPEPRPAQSEQRRLMSELREGLHWVFQNRYLRAVAVVGALCNFFITASQSMFILYAVNDKGIDPQTLGLILSMGACGGVIGAVIAGRLIRRLPLGRVYAGSLIVAFCTPALIPAAGGPQLLVTAMFIVAFFFTFIGVSVVNVVILSLRQTVTPHALMGRMNAAMRTLMFGMGALGAPIAGLLAGVIGVRGALWASAIGSAAIMVPVLLSPVRRLREMPPDPDAEPEPEHSLPETVIAA
jgi:MFS family permease